jgi:hypothetical protein
MKPLLLAISAIAVLSAGGCATTTSVKKTDVHSAIDEADTAYRRLPSALPAYNAVVQKVADRLEKSEPAEFAVSLTQLGVEFDYPHIGLPLRHVEVPDQPADPTALGVSVVLGYDNANAPLYSPEGLFVDATAVYEHSGRKRSFNLATGQKTFDVEGHELPLAFEPTGASNHLKSF